MVYLQEFFGTGNSKEDLVRILNESGFQTNKKYNEGNAFNASNTFVFVRNVQDPKTHVEKIGFVLELEATLNFKNYANEHPLRTFFSKLDHVELYGNSNLPKYELKDYMPRIESPQRI